MDPILAALNDTLGSEQQQQPQKRNRILLSCAPCRISKLKCDRNDPCGQCAKKLRPDACIYAPKPVKRKPPPKGMTARLKRLEGMVRNMMDAEGGNGSLKELLEGATESKEISETQQSPMGHVVQSNNVSTYVGATHCMAMLEDIEDMKAYFDEGDDAEDESSPPDQLDGAEMLLYSRNGPGDRNELLSQLPEKHVADRLVMRYFASVSPSQFVIHKPTFIRNYAKFWQDPESVSLHWTAQLFMVLALGIIFNHFVAPHELKTDSSVPVMERIRNLRSCAAWALIWGKYTQPTIETLPAFILYVEAFFLFNRAAQMNCYVLSGVCIRLMVKMGLHRDPSKLANISPYEGEMRRRFWCMGKQIELLVSFHMGLPSMIQGIESDSDIPKNYQDEDFDEGITEMPTERPHSDHTTMTYPISKIKLLQVFGNIARQAHSLNSPIYAETMHLDTLLNEAWDAVPACIKIRPLEESVGDAPSLVIQRFGLASLYNKSRCVLHRRYLTESVKKREHDYSRRQCLEGAVTLLNYQSILWNATRPGNSLSQCGWFMTSLSVHDYMLSAMVLYLVIQDEDYTDSGRDMEWISTDKSMPPRSALIEMLKRSYSIWTMVSSTVGELRKTADTLSVMLAKLGSPVPSQDDMSSIPSDLSPYKFSNGPSTMSCSTVPESTPGGDVFGETLEQTNLLSLDASKSLPEFPTISLQPISRHSEVANYPDAGAENEDIFGTVEFDSSWIQMAESMDWRQIDIFGSGGNEGSLEQNQWEQQNPGWMR